MFASPKWWPTTRRRTSPTPARSRSRSARRARRRATSASRRRGCGSGPSDYVFALAEMQVESGGKNVARGVGGDGAGFHRGGALEHARTSSMTSTAGASCRTCPTPRRRRAPRAAPLPRAAIRETEKARQRLVESLGPGQLQADLPMPRRGWPTWTRQLRTRPPPSRCTRCVSIPPRPIRVLHRGDVEQHKDAVTPAALACVPGPDADFKLSENGTTRAAPRRPWPSGSPTRATR